MNGKHRHFKGGRLGLALCAAGVLFSAPPAWADRGGHGHGHYSSSSRVHGNVHFHGGGHHFWGPLGVIVGASVLYSMLQPRMVYSETRYEPRVTYTPPVYYVPPPQVVRSYAMPGDVTVVQQHSYAPAQNPPIVVGMAPPPSMSGPVSSNAEPGPGASGAQWWYACRNPKGYYPHVRECPSGWEKLPPVPADAPR